MEDENDDSNEWDVDENDEDKLDATIASLTSSMAIEPTVPKSNSPITERNKHVVTDETISPVNSWEGPQFPAVWLEDWAEPDTVYHSISDEYIESKLQSFLQEQQGADGLEDTKKSKKGGKEEEGYEGTPGHLKAVQRFQALIRRCPRQGTTKTKHTF